MEMFSKTVPRAMYDEAVADRRRAEDRLAGSVPASVYSDAVARLSSALEQAMESNRLLTTEMANIKRHDVGLHPKDFDPSLQDPMSTLGPKARLAIEEFAGGDPSIRQYLIARAALEQAALRTTTDDAGTIDDRLAVMIRDGDQ